MTTEIQLTKGKIALIDDIDADMADMKWCANGRSGKRYYAVRRSSYRMIKLHRIIMERILCRVLEPCEHVDHVNNDSLDNRRSNLRIANRSQQRANSKKQPRREGSQPSSRYKGVFWNTFKSGGGCWRANIGVNYHQIYLGDFKDEIDAARAYDEAAREHFGSYARTNFG